MSISLNPYLIFDGNTKEAIHFYEKALGGKVIGITKFGDMPEDPNYPLSDDMKNRVMHGHLQVGGQVIMPLQKTDWSPLYGQVKDKFGVTFQVNVPGE
ncbi:VOC family protein [Sporosarcina beigongshangi]|uniref:glyoxalase/bleomycin resistance/extradiol dioxygenase family protein n=1 Tax=Sporosarcina beigongshangi TaxID=2782538 RepID=UPI0019396DF3|nr:glyoxalase/bleomycin resistance/extradiol dioxygenase family protein [Sporosarcina beigongshangi]